ncbi:HtaA domain-containing protein [Arcanobacterium canis]
MPKKTAALLATLALSIGSLAATSTVASADVLPHTTASLSKLPATESAPRTAAHLDGTVASRMTGCTPEKPEDTRTSNVKLTVTKPDVIDVTKPATFTVHGTGYRPETEGPAGSGVYILVDSTNVWRINKCLTLKGQGGLFAQWIPAYNIHDGEFTYTFTVPADTFKKGHSYSIGAIAAHAAALSTRYFDRGIEITIPGNPDEDVRPVQSVSTSITGKDATVSWKFDGDYSGYEWRAMVTCVDKCASVRTTRAIDMARSTDRSYRFDDMDNGIYEPSVFARKEVKGKYVESEPVLGKRFAIGVELPADPVDTPPAKPAQHHLSWPVTSTYAKYLAMPFVGAKVISSDGALSTFTTKDKEKGAFVFPYDAKNTIDTAKMHKLSFNGSNRVTGHKGVLDTAISNPSLVKSADGTWAFKADITAKSRDGKLVNVKNGTILTGGTPKVTVKDDIATIVFSGFTFAKDGAEAFGYNHGKEASDITVTVPASIKKFVAPSGKQPKAQGKKTPLPTPHPTHTSAPQKSQPKSQSAEKCHVDPTKTRITRGTLSWGLRSSFTNYVQGSIAKGSISPKNATFANRQFMFSASGGSFDTTKQSGTIHYTGSVHFGGHDGKLNMTISNPSLVISGKSATLYMNVSSSSMDGKVTNYGRVAFANVKLSTLSVSNGSLNFGSSSVSLTASGAKAFAGFYSAGEHLDNMSGGAKLVANSQCTANGKLKIYDEFGNVSSIQNAGDNGRLSHTGASVLPQTAFALMTVLVGCALMVRRQRAA